MAFYGIKFQSPRPCRDLQCSLLIEMIRKLSANVKIPADLLIGTKKFPAVIAVQSHGRAMEAEFIRGCL